MRDTVAKRLRKQIYGDNFSYRDVKYRKDETGKVFCSGRKALYKQLKRKYKSDR